MSLIYTPAMPTRERCLILSKRFNISDIKSLSLVADDAFTEKFDVFTADNAFVLTTKLDIRKLAYYSEYDNGMFSAKVLHDKYIPSSAKFILELLINQRTLQYPLEINLATESVKEV